jgi:hypothetical protein
MGVLGAKTRSNVPTFQQKRFSHSLNRYNILIINNIYNIGAMAVLLEQAVFCWNALEQQGGALMLRIFNKKFRFQQRKNQ